MIIGRIFCNPQEPFKTHCIHKKTYFLRLTQNLFCQNLGKFKHPFSFIASGETPKSVTFLAVSRCPAARLLHTIDSSLHTGGVQEPRTDISAFLYRFVANNVVFPILRQQRPVNSGNVAELLITFNADIPSHYVGEANKPYFPQMWHFKNHQGVMEEEVSATNYGQIGKKFLETFQTVDTEEEKVLCDNG